MGNVFPNPAATLSSVKPCLLILPNGKDINGVQVMDPSAVLSSVQFMLAVNSNGDALK
jgi:hypothetical protein